jgi:hypothetical protein
LSAVLDEFDRVRATDGFSNAAFGVVLYYELSDHAEVQKRGIIESDEATGG